MHLPQPGDLISIDKKVHGAIINNMDTNNLKWALVEILPGQNGLVLECYDPKALSNSEVAKATDEMLIAQQERMARKISPHKRPPYTNVPKEIRMLVITIADNILEVVFDPDYMSILTI
mgnify:CR=1 FL=1|tara:strand:- start:272 stop:628 length:357 start_codon:yes stop_codon:yes gene_type:complete